MRLQKFCSQVFYLTEWNIKYVQAAERSFMESVVSQVVFWNICEKVPAYCDVLHTGCMCGDGGLKSLGYHHIEL